jgi:hypothetical protein
VADVTNAKLLGLLGRCPVTRDKSDTPHGGDSDSGGLTVVYARGGLLQDSDIEGRFLGPRESGNDPRIALNPVPETRSGCPHLSLNTLRNPYGRSRIAKLA